MKHSDSIANLALALSKAQGEMPAAQMNATNPFLKNKYADLGSVIETAKPVLAKYGLSVVQLPIGDGGKIGVETILMHESGEWVSNELTLEVADEKGKSAAQVAGSIISYLRRYSLSAALGIYADEDTDGNKPQPKQEPAPRPAQPKNHSSANAPADIQHEAETDPPRKTKKAAPVPSLSPQYLVDNELSSNIPHASVIINKLGLAGKKATDENLALIAKYRKFKNDGMDDENAFAAALVSN